MRHAYRITANQLALLAAIRDWPHVYCPSIRELTTAVGASSTSVVDYNLRRLVALGYISREKGKSRTIKHTAKAVPLFYSLSTIKERLAASVGADRGISDTARHAAAYLALHHSTATVGEICRELRIDSKSLYEYAELGREYALKVLTDCEMSSTMRAAVTNGQMLAAHPAEARPG